MDTIAINPKKNKHDEHFSVARHCDFCEGGEFFEIARELSDSQEEQFFMVLVT